MKQHILPEQVLEVNEEQFYSLFDDIVRRKDYATYHHKKMSIGKMIEILEHKFYCIQIQILSRISQPREKICLHLWYELESDKHLQIWGENEVDALWDAVKATLAAN